MEQRLFPKCLRLNRRATPSCYLGFASRPWEGAALFYSQRAVQIFQIFQNVFGGTNRLVRVIACQAAADPSYWTDVPCPLRLPTPWQHADALAIAPYLTFSPSPGGSPLDSNVVTNWPVSQVLDYVQTNCLPQSLGWVTGQKAVADKYGLSLICYEAGQGLVGVGAAVGNNALTTLLENANRDPGMGAIYTNYLNAWIAAGGTSSCACSNPSAPLANTAATGTSRKMPTKRPAPNSNAVIGWNNANARPLPQLKAAAPQNGSMSIQLVGQADQSYILETSSNLLNWQILTDASSNTNGQLHLLPLHPVLAPIPPRPPAVNFPLIGARGKSLHVIA